MPPSGGQKRRRDDGARWPLLIVLVAALAALALILWLIFGRQPGSKPFQPVQEDTNSSTPSIKGWDETTKPTPPPSNATLVDCPVTTDRTNSPQRNDGRIHGGGLSVEKIRGWGNDRMYLDWVSDFHTQTDEVRPGWISNIGLGQLNAEDGFNNAQIAARQTMECFASSGYYENFTNRVDLRSEAMQVGSYYAWRMTSEVHISSPLMPEIEGDIVDVIVVDIGDPTRLGLWVSSVTIGDQRRQALVDAAVATLRVG